MGSLKRKQRRAAAKRRHAPIEGFRVLPEHFSLRLDQLSVLGGFANHVSATQTGLTTTTAGSYASMVFAKCCAHARSIGAIAAQSSMFDHHAIMSLARMIVEASTMISYLLEPVSSEEWMLRETLLRLHDTAARIKLLRSYEHPVDDLREGREQLKKEIASNPEFDKLSDDRKKRLLSGEEMFVVGMRSVATKSMGWDEDQFSGVYAYLSAHTHSAPVSFTRMADHRIDYFFPSKAQIEILLLPMEVAIACLRRSILRMIDQHPEQMMEYHPEILAEARRLDASSPLFRRV